MSPRDIADCCGDEQCLLNAVFAARAGAKHVYAIEASGLASKARENITKNGFKDKITYVAMIAQ